MEEEEKSEIGPLEAEDLKNRAERAQQREARKIKGAFQIEIIVKPDIYILIETKEPCDAMPISGAVVEVLRRMRLEPNGRVL